MKKIYMKPEIFVAKIKVECMLDMVSGPKVKIPSGDNPPTADPSLGMESKGRGDYGSDSNFGDLW